MASRAGCYPPTPMAAFLCVFGTRQTQALQFSASSSTMNPEQNPSARLFPTFDCLSSWGHWYLTGVELREQHTQLQPSHNQWSNLERQPKNFNENQKTPDCQAGLQSKPKRPSLCSQESLSQFPPQVEREKKNPSCIQYCPSQQLLAGVF